MKEIISYGRFRCTELSPHKNRGMEITYIEKGSLEWSVEGVPEKVEAGSVFFTLPWQAHGSLHPREPDNTTWHVLFHLEEDYPDPHKQFRFPACLGFNASEMKLLSSVFSASIRHSFRATPAMRWLMLALISELQSSHELRNTHSISLLRALLVEFKRIVAEEISGEGIRTWAEEKVQRLITELSSSCDQQWSLSQMAEKCGIQRTQLNAVFQKLTGSTPIKYLARLRVERAKTLLRKTNIKIIDIAFECGFSSSQYFANTFNHATGMTPSGYRTHCTGLTTNELRKWEEIDFRSEREEHQRVKKFRAD